MADVKLTPLQRTAPSYWAGFTENKHIYNIFKKKDQVISDFVDMLYPINLGSPDIVTFLKQFGYKEIDDENYEYDWYLQDREERTVRLVEATLEDFSTAPTEAGKGGSKFWLHFPEPYFFKTEIITGEKPDDYQFYICSEAQPAGTNWAYEVQLIDSGDQTLYVPSDELSAGKQFSVETAVETQFGGRRGGGTRHSSPFKFSNVLSHLRKEYKVYGSMLNGANAEPLAMNIYTPDGKKATTWLSRLDWDFMQQYMYARAKLIIGGKGNRLTDGTYGNKGSNGNVMQLGFGLNEQLMNGNLWEVNDMSVGLLEDIGRQLSFGKLGIEDREFLIMTGEEGSIDFHKAISDKADSITYLSDNRRMHNDGKQKYGVNGQFVSYSYVNGIKYSVMIDHMKDDDVRNKERDSSGALLKSKEMDIINVGHDSKSPNIQLVRPTKNGSFFKYRGGMRNPFDPHGGENPYPAVTTIDGWELHRGEHIGVKIGNPMKTAKIRVGVSA